MPRIVRTKPQLIVKDGKPNAVIIDIKDYERLLEQLEDREDLEDLAKIRSGKLSFRKFDDFLAEDNAL